MTDERENMEWINEFPALKQVNPANAFVVPVNYFSEMEGQVMGRVNLDNLKVKDTQGQGFKVPENYFNDLEQNIQSRVAIDEIVNNGQSFAVPNGYFDELEQNIQNRIAIESLLNTEKGFTVPDGYFNELEKNIQSRVAVDELLNSQQSFVVPDGYFNELEQNIQSRIAIEQNDPAEGFAIPQGYFESLESKILAQTTLQPDDKVVKERGVVVKLWTKHAFKYASAACFSLVIGVGLFLSEFNINNSSHKHSYLHKAVAKMSNDEIETYLQLNTDVATLVTSTDADDSDLQAVINAEETNN